MAGSLKRFAGFAVSFCTLGLGVSATVAAEDAPNRPNILLVLSDDQSVPHVGCYGDPDIKTPNLDRFATQGMRFDRAYASSPQCVPSRATIMTGRSPVRIGMSRFSAPLPEDIITYPEILRAHGYFSGVAGRDYHMDGMAKIPELKAIFDKCGLPTYARRLDYVRKTEDRAETLAQLREFLDAVPRGKPFFLQLCYRDPHRPYDEHAIPDPHDPARLKLPPWFPDTPGVRADFARYYDEIARFDGCMGDVLVELDKRGLAASTLVVVMGDNGAALFRGKGTLYEFGIHVPLLVRWPGVVKAGSSTAELISGEDIAPTFLEAAGVSAPKNMTGRSFLPLLRGEAFEGRKYVFAERGAHAASLPVDTAQFDLSRCVESKRYKLIYNVLWQLPYTPVDFYGDDFWKELKQMHAQGRLSPQLSRLYFSPTRPMFELYDLERDPNEFVNLAGKESTDAVEEELKEALYEWMLVERDFVPMPIPDWPRPKRR
jgi:N-sulfoglucosamine sulfohydrolase